MIANFKDRGVNQVELFSVRWIRWLKFLAKKEAREGFSDSMDLVKLLDRDAVFVFNWTSLWQGDGQNAIV